MSILKENKPAIVFLLTFVGLYLLLNTVYGFYVNSFLPQPDPITLVVSKHVAWLLSWWDESVTYALKVGYKNVILKNSYRTVIEVFEGCNSVNVMIVFVSFMAAFRGKLKSTIIFSMVGLVIIYGINLFRVAMLYGIEIYLPRYLYFFHKYLFTGALYAVVFLLWFVWARRIKHEAA
jgi:exosortase family protein XrtF